MVLIILAGSGHMEIKHSCKNIKKGDSGMGYKGKGLREPPVLLFRCFIWY